MTIFEKIIARKIPSNIVYEDELVIAFLDIQQVTKGHTLVVPKKAYKDIYEVPEDVFLHLMKVVKLLSNAIKKAFNPIGLNLLNNNHEIAGQSVFHYHFHILPRYDQNEINFNFNNKNNLSENDYKNRAKAIREALL